MRKLLIGLVCFAGSIFCQAQSFEIERLKTELEKSTASDTARVNLLIKILLASPRVSVEDFNRYNEEALRLSEMLAYEVGIGHAKLNQARIAIINNDKVEAQRFLAQADSLAKKTEDPILQFWVYLRFSSFEGNSDYRRSLPWLQKAEELAMEINNHRLMAQAQLEFANNNNLMGNYASSMEYSFKSLENAKIAEDNRIIYSSYNSLGSLYVLIGEYDKATEYLNDLIKLHKELGYGNTQLADIYNGLGENYRLSGDMSQSLVNYNLSLQYAVTPLDSLLPLSNMADTYVRMDRLDSAFQAGYSSLTLAKKNKEISVYGWIYGILSRAHLKQNNLDSALYYASLGFEMGQEIGIMEDLRDNALSLSEAYARKNDFKNALFYYQNHISYRDRMLSAEVKNKSTVLEHNFQMQQKEDEIALLNEQKKAQQNFLLSALIVLGLILIAAFLLIRNIRQKQRANRLLNQQKLEIDEKATQLAIQKESLEKSYQNVELLGEIGRKITSSLSVDQIIGTIYQNVNGLMDASVFGIGIYHETTRSLDFPATYENGQALPPYSNSLADQNRLAAICFNSQEEIVINDVRQEYGKYLQQMPKATEGQVPTSLIYLPLIVKDRRFGVLTVQSFRPNAFSDYHLYMLRTVALYAGIALENAESFDQLGEALNSLQETQAQLIQSEKMASLGELTAGIAHEIKNPLNFVNNFADLSIELVEEMKEELENGNTEEAISLANDIKDNLAKIHQHGGRADRIVKSMLLHSRGGSGQMESTDINGKIREFSNLAFHGMRAGNKAINVEINLNLDEKIGEIPLYADDFNRVILNLCNNAFDAMREKGEEASSKSAGYKPLLTISSKKLEKGVGLIFEDNGPGIPEEIKDKILQPFFTTKKGTEGTGLGLSITHDIIKRHNGNLEIHSIEGEQTQFIIFLPTLN